ncbi:MAG TPA: family 20 glycosylhydrolase [Planctomycetota bacterium]|jgi:hypothetical protein
MPQELSETRLYLLPYPRNISLRGAPLRPAPSNYLYISDNATVNMRRRCHVLCKQLYECGFRTNPESTNRLSPTQALFTPAATMPKWDGLERPLRGQCAAPEGYRMNVTSVGVLMHSADDQGMQHAGATLKQLLLDGPEIPGMEIEDYPLLPWRIMHLDFRGWAPTAEHLKQIITNFADLKINALILDYESFFDFPSQPGLASEGALSPAEVSEIELHAQDFGVTLIPLVPCLGNVNHVLRLPSYAALREHPEYFQQYCPVLPETLGIVTAMMEDLASIHLGKFIHAGGDEVRLLGAHPASEARAKQLGGRAALYLDYVGKVSRYLVNGGRIPMLWDDMFRRMSDEQVKWLPEEAILNSWQYEGHGGHATPAILTNLDRYRRLGRRVWGAATRSPAARYDAFDNIDAWTEAAEMGYVDGLVTTAWTRDHTLGPLFAPSETTWPAALYAAERMWSGIKGLPREQFPQRFVVRMFGAKDAALQSRLWAGMDLILREHYRQAREYLAPLLNMVPRGANTLGFLESWCAIGALKDYVRSFETDVSSNYSNLLAGCGDPFNSGRLRWRVLDAKAKAGNVIARFQQQALRLTSERQIQEYIESSVAYSLKQLEEMDSLLTNYPLPPPEWQQAVHI